LKKSKERRVIRKRRKEREKMKRRKEFFPSLDVCGSTGRKRR